MYGHWARIASRATVGAAAAALAIGLVGAPSATAVDAQSLVGSWSGPATLGDTGECAPASGLFAFSPNGGYRYLAIYPDCGIVMIDGRYELQNGGDVLQLSMDECGDPGCPPGSPLTQSISATGPDTIVVDGRFTYQRQHD
jgi:hypothetical protein